MYKIRQREITRLEKSNQENSSESTITASNQGTSVESLYLGLFVYASPIVIFIENVVFLYLMYKFIKWLIKK